MKSLYLVFLLASWSIAFHVFKRIRANDLGYKRGWSVFCVYFLLMMFILLILWPGTWAWDDLWTINGIKNYDSFHAWQHFFTGLYQDVLLQVFPFPGGIILLQNVIVSVCVSFVVTKLEATYNIVRLRNIFLDTILKVIPFLLPPVLMYQFSGYRIGLHIYLELVLLVILICGNREKDEWCWPYTILLGLLSSIVATWRTEAFIYIPCVCVLSWLIKEEVLPKKKKYICIIISVLLSYASIIYKTKRLEIWLFHY